MSSINHPRVDGCEQVADKVACQRCSYASWLCAVAHTTHLASISCAGRISHALVASEKNEDGDMYLHIVGLHGSHHKRHVLVTAAS